MAVKCNKCGGAHPSWECVAKPAQIATYRLSVESDKSAVERVGQIPAEVGKTLSAKAKNKAMERFVDGMRPAQDMPRIEGAKFVATLPPGSQMHTYGNRVIVVAPGMAPSIVTSKGLVPITVPVSTLKKGGRPKTVENRRAHKTELQRKYRKRAEKGEA